MPKKILVVEDNKDVLQLEKEVLVSAGYEVLEATNAKDGVETAEKECPDLIIMDIRLPSKKRGIGAAKILRGHKATRNVPIIFVTGYLKGEHTAEIENIPMCGYITKPFKIPVLLEEIKKFLA